MAKARTSETSRMSMPLIETETDQPAVLDLSMAPRGDWLRWLRKGGLAITDQGLISGSNFVISILLARWLVADQYGAYALAFAGFILVSQLHQALLLEPMSVFGGSLYRRQLRDYLGALLWMHSGAVLAVSALLALGTIGTYLYHGSRGLPGALAGITIASPCILMFWLVRRAFYLELRPAGATLGAFLYCALVVGLLTIARFMRILSPFTAFLIIGAAALFTGIALLLRLKPVLKLRHNALSLTETCQQHWIYGRWALASAITMWIPTNIFYVLVGSFSGMARAGELRALMNLTLPVGQVATALSLIFLPYASRVRMEHGPKALNKIASLVTLLYATGAAAYWIIILSFHRPILHMLYGGRYSSIGSLLPIVALSSIFQVSINGPGVGLRADEAPRRVFYAYLISSGIALAVGVAATHSFGTSGAVMTMLFSYMAAFCTAQLLFSRDMRLQIEQAECLV